jgi:hypothetical protein
VTKTALDLIDYAAVAVTAVLVTDMVRDIIQRQRIKRRAPMSGKRYGKPQSNRLPVPYGFELTASLDDDDEVHSFVAVRQVDKLLAGSYTGYAASEAHRQVELLVKLISKTLDDKDGTPATWAPVQLPPPPVSAHDVNPMVIQGTTHDAALAALRLEQTVTVSPMPKFRGPDGELYDMDHAEKFASFSAGSSRRRFLALVGDVDRTVEAEMLGELVKDLIAVSAGRPTVAS